MTFIEKKIEIKLVYFSFKKLSKNGLNIVQVISCDVYGCFIGVYNFILLKSSIKMFYITNIPNFRELLTSRVSLTGRNVSSKIRKKSGG